MKEQVIDLKNAKLYLALKRLKTTPHDKIREELETLKKISATCLQLANTSNYFTMCRIYIPSIIVDLPILARFFEDIKEFSKEAYDFICDGYDIANLKDFFIKKIEDQTFTHNFIWGFDQYVNYITYSIFKILKTNNIQKQYVMIRGMVGM